MNEFHSFAIAGDRIVGQLGAACGQVFELECGIRPPASVKIYDSSEESPDAERGSSNAVDLQEVEEAIQAIRRLRERVGDVMKLLGREKGSAIHAAMLRLQRLDSALGKRESVAAEAISRGCGYH